ncbi:hypothetical protein ACLBOM_26045 [Escherichia coli]
MNNEPLRPTPIVCWNKLPRRIGGSSKFSSVPVQAWEDLGDAGRSPATAGARAGYCGWRG